MNNWIVRDKVGSTLFKNAYFKVQQDARLEIWREDENGLGFLAAVFAPGEWAHIMQQEDRS